MASDRSSRYRGLLREVLLVGLGYLLYSQVRGLAGDRVLAQLEDVDAHMVNLDKICAGLQDFMAGLDYLYLTVCLDVFTAATAPGVSAPASVGISSELVIRLLREIRNLSAELEVPIILSDVAELNPHFDIDQRTARLAARLVWELT